MDIQTSNQEPIDWDVYNTNTATNPYQSMLYSAMYTSTAPLERLINLGGVVDDWVVCRSAMSPTAGVFEYVSALHPNPTIRTWYSAMYHALMQDNILCAERILEEHPELHETTWGLDMLFQKIETGISRNKLYKENVFRCLEFMITRLTFYLNPGVLNYRELFLQSLQNFFKLKTKRDLYLTEDAWITQWLRAIDLTGFPKLRKYVQLE